MFVIQCIYNQPEPNFTMSKKCSYYIRGHVIKHDESTCFLSCWLLRTPSLENTQLCSWPELPGGHYWFFFPPLERTSGKDVHFFTVIFHIQQEVIALISVWPQIFLSEIYKQRNTDEAFIYLFSGLLQWLPIFGSLSPIIQEFRKTQHNWYGTLGSYFKNSPHSKALKTLFF